MLIRITNPEAVAKAFRNIADTLDTLRNAPEFLDKLVLADRKVTAAEVALEEAVKVFKITNKKFLKEKEEYEVCLAAKTFADAAQKKHMDLIRKQADALSNREFDKLPAIVEELDKACAAAKEALTKFSYYNNWEYFFIHGGENDARIRYSLPEYKRLTNATFERGQLWEALVKNVNTDELQSVISNGHLEIPREDD